MVIDGGNRFKKVDRAFGIMARVFQVIEEMARLTAILLLWTRGGSYGTPDNVRQQMIVTRTLLDDLAVFFGCDSQEGK